MSLQKPLIAHLLLLISLLGGFGFLGFYPIFHIELISEACTVFLFLWLAFSVPIDSRWFLYIFAPAFGLIVFILLYAYIFTVRTDAPILPSLIAQRYYIFFLLAPITYALRAHGWRLADFQRIFILAMFLCTMSRIVADLTLSNKSLLLSGSLFTYGLNEVYNQQAYLIRRLDLSVLFLALYFSRRFGRRLMRGTSLYLTGFDFVVMALSLTLLLVDIPRVLLVSAILALILQGIFFARPQRAKMFVILLPLCTALVALLIPQIDSILAGMFNQDLSYTVRLDSTSTAWQAISKHPLFGIGQDSVASISYQDLFGGNFYPSDIGLLGIAFQFGLAGLLLYLLFCGWFFITLLKVLWSFTGNVSETHSKVRAFVWTLFIIGLAIILGSLIQARFIKPEGLSIAAFTWGLLVARKHHIL